MFFWATSLDNFLGNTLGTLLSYAYVHTYIDTHMVLNNGFDTVPGDIRVAILKKNKDKQWKEGNRGRYSQTRFF